MSKKSLTNIERTAIVSLSAILGLRMLGLFMVLPVFSLYALQLSGATPTLVGVATGIYGLFQALFQILFGALSDHYGRKPIIVLGLCLFIVGSIVAAHADSMWWMIIGRGLQGIGAIGGTILATMADLTSEEQRTNAMMIAGITIGFSFSLAMFLGPIFSQWLTVSGLFLLAAGCGLFAILVMYYFTPTPARTYWHRDTEPELTSFFKIIVHPELAKLNSGIFILHAIFTATFIVIPISLLHSANLTSHEQWHIYLPTLLIGSIFAFQAMRKAELQQQVRRYFLLGIFVLLLAELMLTLISFNFMVAAVGLCLFFASFSLLEAFLPSLVSRTAPVIRKGSALGVYSCSQFLGIFSGGVLGGWIYGHYHEIGVYIFCSLLAFFWFILAFFMSPPRYLITYMLRLPPTWRESWQQAAVKLERIQGITEINFVAEENMIYLKMERAVKQHPDFIRLQEQLQSN